MSYLSLWARFLLSLAALAATTATAAAAVKTDLYAKSKVSACTPISAGNTATDDVPAIEAAFAICGAGGTIIIPAGKTYNIRSTLSFTGCASCTFQIDGTLKTSNDLNYWQGKRAIFYIESIKTAKVYSSTGTGVVDGNGQAAWDRFATDTSYKRPTLWYITNSSGITISDLSFKNPPNVFHSVSGSSSNIIYSQLSLSAISTSSTLPKNTDGWDIGSASTVSIADVKVSNQDDCIALKPGADNVYVNNISCTGSHGISVGSLAGGAGSTDVVQNIYISNAHMVNSTKAVGIKLYPSGPSHGTAIVRNVTWQNVSVDNCPYAVQIQSCYGETTSYCATYPSTGQIENVKFLNFNGVTSGKYGDVVANLDCPAKGSCGVSFVNWAVKPPKGTGSGVVQCANEGSAGIAGISCSPGASG